MRTTMLARACATALLAAAALPAAHAVDLKPDGVSFQAGGGEGTGMAGVGIIWDWRFDGFSRKAELTAHTELLLNGWHSDAIGGGHTNYAQIALLPTLRMRLDRGNSPWFIEIGVGPSYLNHPFRTPDKEFSTQWNFYDVLGAGYSFGPEDKEEIGVRWTHTSNAGIRNPNPGQDFLQIRYVSWF